MATARTTSVGYRAGRVQLPTPAATDANGDVATGYSLTIPANTLGAFYLGASSTTALSGTVSISPANADNLFCEPNGSNSGPISATYTATAGGSTSAAASYTVTLANLAPVAVADAVATTASTAVAINVLANDSDPDGNSTLDVGSIVTANVTNGTVSFNNATGVVTFTPSGNTAGSFTYTVADKVGVRSNSVRVDISIVTATADVVATLSGPTSAPAGSYVTYILSIQNNTTVTRVAPRIQLPANLQTVTASLSAIYNSSTGLVQFPALNDNISPQTVTVRFIMPDVAVTGTGSTSSTTYSDTNPANNNGSASASRVTTTPTRETDIAASITGPLATAPGASTTVNLVASNYGPSVATNVVLQATVSKGLTGTNVSDGGTYDPATGVITLPAINTLAASTARSFTFTFTSSKQSITSFRGTVTAASATPDPAAANNDGTAAFSNLTTISSNTVSSQACLTASTIDLTTAADQQINTYYPGTGTAAAGSKTVTVGTPTSGAAIVAGDLILIMQMQGADINTSNTDAYGDGVASANTPANGTLGTNQTAGLYEYRYVEAVSGSTLTLRLPLTHTYRNADFTTSSGQQRYQVIRVPRYRTLTLGATLSPLAWNGRTGGVLVLEVGGTLNFSGRTINASGLGFRGGAGRQLVGPGATGTSNNDYAVAAAANVHASKGEGIAGTPQFVNNAGVNNAEPLLDNGAEGYPGGSYGRGAPGNAGGGGTDGNTTSNESNTGGGGGSNGGFGGQGGNAWNLGLPSGGNGGAPFLSASPSRLILGGGGGAGTTNNGTGNNGSTAVSAGFNSSGVAGGGIVIINTKQVSGSGTVNVNGASNSYTVANDGSGGGGAGGSVVILSQSSLSNITVQANGGNGGSNNLTSVPHGPGGGGSAGVVFTSSAINSASQVAAGTNGLTGGNASGSTVAFGATSGSQFASLVRSNIVQGDLPNITQASNCTPALPVTLVAFGAQAAGLNAHLNWKTAQELNNDHFVVERSFDARSFVAVGQVEGQGSTQATTSYAYTDERVANLAPAGLVYYRLRQVDTDGTASLSEVQTVRFPLAARAQIDVYPNPAPTLQDTRLDLSGVPVGAYQVTLVDMTGRVLRTFSQNGGTMQEMQLTSLPNGTYLVQVQGNGQSFSRRFIKQ